VVVVVGDINGDGFADLAVGQPNGPMAQVGSSPGVVSVYLGSAGGPAATPSRVFQGTVVGQEFGYAIASAWSPTADRPRPSITPVRTSRA
jgi:hypothetical protein